jgi:cell division septum initiation protein DivIVA
MQKDFRKSLFGYSRRQVREFITRLNCEHEIALASRNDRFMELRDQNNIMKAELAGYRSKEQEISSVLIKARAVAQEIVLEGEQNAVTEKARLMEEIKQLDRLAQALYQKLEEATEQAADTVRGFEQELNELLEKKEAFLKATYGFQREGEAIWKMKM